MASTDRSSYLLTSTNAPTYMDLRSIIYDIQAIVASSGGGDILADGSVNFTGIETFEAGLKTNEIWSQGSASHIIDFDDVGNVTSITDPTGNVVMQLNGATDTVSFTVGGGASFTSEVLADTLKTSDIDVTYTAEAFKIADAATDVYVASTTVAIPIEVGGVTYFLGTVTIV